MNERHSRLSAQLAPTASACETSGTLPSQRWRRDGSPTESTSNAASWRGVSCFGST